MRRKVLTMCAALIVAVGTMAVAFEPVEAENAAQGLGAYGIARFEYDSAQKRETGQILTVEQMAQKIARFDQLHAKVTRMMKATAGYVPIGYVFHERAQDPFTAGEQNIGVTAMVNEPVDGAVHLFTVDGVCYDDNVTFTLGPQLTNINQDEAADIVGAHAVGAYAVRGATPGGYRKRHYYSQSVATGRRRSIEINVNFAKEPPLNQVGLR